MGARSDSSASGRWTRSWITGGAPQRAACATITSSATPGGSPAVKPDRLHALRGQHVNDTGSWILGLPVRRTLIASGARIDDVRMYYDDLPAGAVTQGLMTRRERWAFTSSLLADNFGDVELPALDTLGYRAIPDEGGDDEFWFDEYRADHDARGNVVRLRGAMGNATTIQYDPQPLLDPIRSENAAGHVHQAIYHPRLGAIATLIDPAGNVGRQEFSYDARGRLASTRRWIGDGRPFEYFFQYDPDDRITSTRYPGGGARPAFTTPSDDSKKCPGL